MNLFLQVWGFSEIGVTKPLITGPQSMETPLKIGLMGQETELYHQTDKVRLRFEAKTETNSELTLTLMFFPA